MTHFTGLVALLFLLTACTAASGSKYQDTQFATQQAPADKARIIFLREDDRFIEGRYAHVYFDGAAVGKLAREGFLVVETIPGEREISVDGREEKPRFALKFNLDASQTYYLQVSWREEYWKYTGLAVFGGIVGALVGEALKDDNGPFEVESFDPSQGKNLLREFRLSE
jgi:hypothetical protein